MSTLSELLTTCHQAGILLAADGDRLTFDAPRGAVTPDLRKMLRGRKAELLPIVWRLAVQAGGAELQSCGVQRDERK